ncbi:hydrogenase expression/formation protein HypE [Actinomadura alba]|uniref:Hydrogenase expression/formation protein HypE n=1 Tax=Actinomadura alba TaxID=406431 RepID=A0ABR7LS27_9ACTN|nr:hydrogenase expression/formation protein HypE [Actinomadura alba]MBC6467644.1 hydrogenase expression/formation protein HypE [Actinomadura alba]
MAERGITERSAEWAEAVVREHAHVERASREDQVLERIERVRRRKARLREDNITLAHGAGGKATQTLIEAVFLEAFRNPLLEPLGDSALLGVGGASLAFTTDSYVVSPLFFPGGDIGDLAVNGTVNDLAVSGAVPMFLSAGFILEEGFPVEDLRRIVASMKDAAERAGVRIVTGDTKVVQRGKADGCYVNTAGVGLVGRPPPGPVRPGDAVLVSGPIGEHGTTVMLARGELDIEADLRSDTAALNGMIASLLETCGDSVRWMRDATRGGVATVLNEVAVDAGVAVVMDEDAVPVRPEVRGACELLGIDPLYVACEGRMVAIVDSSVADAALEAVRAHPHGAGAAVIGRIKEDPPGLVLLRTAFGGTRIVDLLVGDPLPRIC